MSLIPLDEPRGDGPAESRDGRDDRGLAARLWAGVKATLVALPGVGAVVSEPSEATASAQSAAAVPATRDPPTERAVPATPSDSPADDSGQLELVCTEEGGTLTVEVVDNPDATIRSDTWESVER